MLERVSRFLARIFGGGQSQVRFSEVQFGEVLDDIMCELMKAREDGNKEISRRAEELSKKLSKETGLNIVIEADMNGATIWINDLQFNYTFVDEFVDEDEPNKSEDESNEGRDGKEQKGIAAPGIDGLNYIQ